MSTLTTLRIAALLQPYFPDPSLKLLEDLSAYLDLLLKWNARTNLTSIREPEEIVSRHFGESLFSASLVPTSGTLLDLGSGAGFPGLPLQLAHPELRITLAESQSKKASFLRESIRTLNLPTEVWARRIEDMAAERLFDVVTLRAVDDPQLALGLARARTRRPGMILHYTVEAQNSEEVLRIPCSHRSFVRIERV